MTQSVQPKFVPPTTEAIRQLLSRVKTIAVVGISDKPDRPSYHVASYLQKKGYRIIPINPQLARLFGETAYDRLEDVPDPIDLADIFRKPDAVPDIVDSAISLGVGAVWMQEGVIHVESALKARAAGLEVVMDRCILKDHMRLAHSLSTNHETR
jgi:predicted CoA-binding protein